jgi:hypothetical protein
MKERMQGKYLLEAVLIIWICATAGLLQQWLIEGRFTEEEALSQSYDMLSAGIDTVRFSHMPIYIVLLADYYSMDNCCCGKFC